MSYIFILFLLDGILPFLARKIRNGYAIVAVGEYKIQDKTKTADPTAVFCQLLLGNYQTAEGKKGKTSKLEALLCERNTDDGNAKNYAY